MGKYQLKNKIIHTHRLVSERGLGLAGMLQTPLFRDIWPRALENL